MLILCKSPPISRCIAICSVDGTNRKEMAGKRMFDGKESIMEVWGRWRSSGEPLFGLGRLWLLKHGYPIVRPIELHASPGPINCQVAYILRGTYTSPTKA